MSSCCASAQAVSPAGTPRCPRTGAEGLGVELLTVKALLSASALRSVRQGPYRFCADATCSVVYFDDSGQVFETADLRVPVWQKEEPGARLVCYCFGENETAMANEVAATGRSDASHRVRAAIAAGRCACEVRNPRGTCCLGDVMKAVARLEDRAADGREPDAPA